MQVGALCTEDGCEFRVWAPRHEQLALHVLEPRDRVYDMQRDDRGYWHVFVPGIGEGARYVYRQPDGTERPDPASAHQPDGVHQASAVVNHRSFQWTDQDWRPPTLAETIQYELHVGTFSPESSFDGVRKRLSHFVELGVNAIELCPVAQFPGKRNWGYDGVYPYAVQHSYGGPAGLKKLVNAAHESGIAVILDVVYNHLGPEGNYLHEYAPYFTDRFKTPWGWAMNLDGAHSDEVRDFFIENALYWFREYHIDGLRLDAIHGMFDMSAHPFLQELAERVDGYADGTGDEVFLIAESDLNDVRVITPREEGGFGIPAQWSDDFHHSLHTLLTGEKDGYYEDFGTIDDLVKAMQHGFVYDNRYSTYRKRHHGSVSESCRADQFVVFSQDHDQVGNRMKGERLSELVSFESLKLAAGAVLFGPNIPMLWMGEEWAEPAPFLYFIDHGDKDLIEAVRNGRAEEFAAFGWKEAPPDPQAETTWDRSRLDWNLLSKGQHAVMLAFYTTLIRLRKDTVALRVPDKSGLEVIGDEATRTIVCSRKRPDSHVIYAMNFADTKQSVAMPAPAARWIRKIDSAEKQWQGPGTQTPETIDAEQSITLQPQSLVLYEQQKDKK